MPERRVCTFCGNEIEPGTGKMYIKRDGTVYNFCSNKCQKNMLVLKRTARRVRWTQRYEKRVRRSEEGQRPKRKLAKIKKLEKVEETKEEKGAREGKRRRRKGKGG